MNILVITPSYPDRFKVHYPFVKQLVDEFSRQGHCCSVIAPYSISKNLRLYKTVETDGAVTVYRPNFLSFSNLKIGKFRISDYFRRRAINRATNMLKQLPDIVYCHFWECAIEGYSYAKKHKIPLFVASGESSISAFFNIKTFPREVAEYVSGVICVSTKNKEESVSNGLAKENNCIVLPNAVNNKLFRRIDRLECRQKLGLPRNAFIVSFVGAFIERKGANRVSAAISRLKGLPVYSIFIGKGKVTPTCDNIVFMGALCHEQIPEYLCASDLFVLPTLKEGCCNAIVEALSCGLPVISSNLSFNWDVLDQTNSIMIDPNNIDELAKAIQSLRDDPVKRELLSAGALEKAKTLTIEKRAKVIIEFIEGKMN